MQASKLTNCLRICVLHHLTTRADDCDALLQDISAQQTKTCETDSANLVSCCFQKQCLTLCHALHASHAPSAAVHCIRVEAVAHDGSAA